MSKRGWLSLINVARAHFNNIILATKAKLRPEEVCQEKESIEKKTREKNWNNRRHKTRTNLQNSYGRKVANKNAYINLKSIERATQKK